MTVLATSIAFRDRHRASRHLEWLSEAVPRGIAERIHHSLASVPDPDSALQALEAFSHEQPTAFERFVRQHPVLQAFLVAASHSRFLTQEIFQHPDWLEEFLETRLLREPFSPQRFRERLSSAVAEIPLEELARTLAQFRRREYLRIVLRDVQGIAALAETTAELSHLADAILQTAYERIRDDIIAEHGQPVATNENGGDGQCGFSVLALGKLGGEELNYSSDIDLMFIYSGNGETNGRSTISNKEFFKKIANRYTALLSSYTNEGLCYRVDLRLRPEGKLGEVAISLEGAKQYYRHRARDWELQMLIKARVAAGEIGPGEALLAFVEPLTYSTTLDFSAVEAVSETRARIHEKAARKQGGGNPSDVKLTRGGIRDVEFLVQCLQRLHGGREPWLRHGGTLLALTRLRDKELLSGPEYSALASAYQYLRNLEHRLQILDDRQTHTLPAAHNELELLARRMPADEIGGTASGERLLQRLNVHLERVQQLYERVIHAQKPMYYGMLETDDLTMTPPSADPPVAEEPMAVTRPAASNAVRFLDQSAPKLAALLSQGHLKRNPEGFELYLDRIEQNPEWLKWLNEDGTLARHVIEIFEHSPWLSDALDRNPEYLADLRDIGVARDTRGIILATQGDTRALRRQFRQEMFRILAESLCRQTPIFETLGKTSELADAVIDAGFRMAVEQVAQTHPPSLASYKPVNQMMVVALGRLGMLEFDLASDADLVFVLPDSDEEELTFWTEVAGRLIELLSAYTGDGTLFAPDTRLRPGGRDGSLVQLEKSYLNYFETRAEAWEGIAYMKARAVAGDVERATKFLNELQQVDWRRYGQSGRSRKQLAQMRLRLEKEQGTQNPLKAGRGGFYDIDFALMYLRLKGAGIFFKTLNTPQRINIIEQMGHLERADAEFLRDAATFYRAIDHGIRLQTGHSGGDIPASIARQEQLTGMVVRWTPDHLHDQPLKVELAQIQERTREYFERLFS